MKILVADDEKNIRQALTKLLELEGFEATGAADGLEAKVLLEQGAWDLALLDLRMPGLGGQALLEWIQAEGLLLPVIMISAHGEIADAVRALKAGARDFIEKPFDSDELISLIRQTVREGSEQRSQEARKRTRESDQELVGISPAIEETRRLIARAAPTPSTILISGESGTGKELVARQIHRASGRSEEPFVAINVGSLPENLVESELFGHEKGAFTGADKRKPGLFELAGSGSLFLDEIGEMPLPLQVKLLRALQDRTIRRLGGTRDIPIEARIISATNRNLEEAVREGLFREDLYYRLNVLRIEIAPLRQRKEDIPLLSKSLLDKLSRRLGLRKLSITQAAIDTLIAWPFPGNVRELENTLERACIYCQGSTIEKEDLGLPLFNKIPEPEKDLAGDPPQPGAKTVRDSEKDLIRKTLELLKGNRTKSAAALGLSRRALQYKIKDYGLEEAGRD